MTLIEDAEEEIILVSPYVSISGWTKMKKCLERAVKRNVKITFFARENAKQDLSFIKQIGINLILVMDLHAKLYLNENCGIITSQNISQYSDTNSIDIGYVTENISERKELIDFIKKYVGSIDPEKKDSIAEKIAQKDIVEKIELGEIEVEYLYNRLRTKYPYCKFKKTSTYVFCGDILSFADVMIDNELTIKFRNSSMNFEKTLSKFETFNFKNYSLERLSTHKTFYYITFIPDNKSDFKKIVEDILEIIRLILKSDI
ncbi:phospholipase D-like domain-containing protein [Halpernia frigidisoli]|uniref:Phospholipase D-like domain-containing protein n=1 Tax=Halpernia frigidisoli TaxID=1125876 RepID=A0A1I3D514_9FLAO|nr:hypothetical protein [Halpernia frigidisoli]SFH81776.1 hypothetical protein SAMN05443292_0262 [Halpernia frigidisoli]